MEYYAHKTDDDHFQTLQEHLVGTAEKARTFAVPELTDYSYKNSLIHDIGKYAPAFQDKLNGKSNGYCHAACGAIEIMQQAKTPQQRMLACMLAYCIAGHHTGLQDGGSLYDNTDAATLGGSLARKPEYTGNADYSAFKDEVAITLPDSSAFQMILTGGRKTCQAVWFERYAFLTRYLYSCLTDADYLDTEQFYSPDIDRGYLVDFTPALKAVELRLAGFRAETPLQKARDVIQKQAFEAAAKCSGISVLKMPTGSGKTLCSLKIALQKIKASSGKLKRIVYVIPYTSIIEQTAAEFEALIGKHVTILQHHSNFCFEDIPEADTAKKLKLTAENWDVPVVITTSVQFFESLYHNKSSRLRKLHNLADSVIVLDEIHLLPVKLLRPCLCTLGFLTQILHSEILMLSATMPDYQKQFQRFLPDCAVHDLITDQSAFRFFEKCSYQYIGETDYETIAQRAAGYQSSLIVVNSRATARNVYGMLSGRKYHLSTFMTPHDRSETIAMIRSALRDNEPVTVVSTSLIEAGVDLDFEAVFRELAGLDNILQSGGRCNREGKREKGDVFIFRTDRKMRGDLQRRAVLAQELLETYASITNPDCIRTYYDRLFTFHDDEIQNGSMKAVIDTKTGFVSIPFRTYAEQFQRIEEDSTGVIINHCAETEALLERLRFGDRSVLRNLQQYAVSLRKRSEFEKAYPRIISEYAHTGVFVLTDLSCYDAETGLHLDSENDIIFG